jgi:hypothetical protein
MYEMATPSLPLWLVCGHSLPSSPFDSTTEHLTSYLLPIFIRATYFVDEDWNIMRIIDLEWACSRPWQMQNVPYWLTSQGLDTIDDEALEAYQVTFDEFIHAVKEVERSVSVPAQPLSHIFQSSWLSGKFWFAQALDSPEALYSVFINHLQSRYGTMLDFDDKFDETLARYWEQNASNFISMKVDEQTAYQQRIQQMFAKFSVVVDVK